MRGKKLLVIDSSVAVKWLHQINEDYLFQADLIIKNAQKKEITLVMPELAKYEIGNALVYKNLEVPILLRLIEDFYLLPIQFVPEDVNLARLTIEIAQNYKMTYYDASFIALAKKLKGVLVTNNPKHQQKYKDTQPKIIALKDYR